MTALEVLIYDFENGLFNAYTLMWRLGAMYATPDAMTSEQRELAWMEIANWLGACKEARMTTRDESDNLGIGFTAKKKATINAAWKTLGGTVEFTSIEFLD